MPYSTHEKRKWNINSHQRLEVNLSSACRLYRSALILVLRHLFVHLPTTTQLQHLHSLCMPLSSLVFIYIYAINYISSFSCQFTSIHTLLCFNICFSFYVSGLAKLLTPLAFINTTRFCLHSSSFSAWFILCVCVIIFIYLCFGQNKVRRWWHRIIFTTGVSQ